MTNRKNAIIPTVSTKNRIACFVSCFILICLSFCYAITMQSKCNQTQAKNTHYNRKILPWRFARCNSRRNKSISRCNQNAIITRSIARRCCIASKFTRRCGYPDRKDKFTARLNFACGIFATTIGARLCCIAAFFAPRCRIDRAALQQVTDVQLYFPV